MSACFCRGLARGVERVEVLELGVEKFGKATIVLPRLEKLIVSVDDTDSEEEGTTYALVHNIAVEASDSRARYLTRVNAQLYPENPDKTKNCMSTAVSFAVKPGFQDRIINSSAGEAMEIAKKSGVEVYEITGPRGVIGALAAGNARQPRVRRFPAEHL